MKDPLRIFPTGLLCSVVHRHIAKEDREILASFWRSETHIEHFNLKESASPQANGSSNSSFMAEFNTTLLELYCKKAVRENLSIDEMWVESIGYFSKTTDKEDTSQSTIHVFYKTNLNSKSDLGALSRIHNQIKRKLPETLNRPQQLKLNGQLLIR